MCTHLRISYVVLALLLGACGGILPSRQTETPSAWGSFDQAKASFDLIVPGETRSQDLARIGFDPMRTPNVRRLNHLEVIEAFMPHPSIQRQELDPALRACIEAREACYAYEMKPRSTHAKRHGNVALDVLGFRRETTTTGWEFTALVVLKEETVAYKVWGGEPNVQREETEKTPLGPLQNAGKLIEAR